MKENLIHYRTSVCNINYHVVWSVKYRRKILDAQVESYLKEIVQQIADERTCKYFRRFFFIIKKIFKN